MGSLLTALGAMALIAAPPPAPPATPAPQAADDGDGASTAVGLRDRDDRMTVDVMIDGAGAVPLHR